jgi:hypothetical protein
MGVKMGDVAPFSGTKFNILLLKGKLQLAKIAESRRLFV